MSHEICVAVPPGVGDTYWALTKVQSFARSRGATKVILCIQQSAYRRAIEWGDMVRFVHGVRELKFRPDAAALATGFSDSCVPGGGYCLWPNAVIDRGEHISRWMPELELDLDFDVHVIEPPPERRGLALVYASSDSINSAWVPGAGTRFWEDLVARLGDRVALIGAGWDASFRERLRVPDGVLDLVGKTSLMEVAGLIKRARLLVGVISGMTILANHFRTPCTALCPTKFPEGFPRAWVKPDAPYSVLRADALDSGTRAADAALCLVRE